jgi:ATP-dependent helicase YprA (DUF1998 family)/very-short-patch-repair endonuclease
MEVFALRDRLTAEYAEYTRSFITIRDRKIREVVDTELAEGLLWPYPIVQLNPAFEPGAYIDDLVSEGVLGAENSRIFRIKKETQDTGSPLRLHRHQSDAVRAASTGQSYVLTTGTGSGKSLAYLIPIVDRVLREGPGQGIKAIVVYPMNALANSQAGELEKFLSFGYPDGKGPVRFARYTGQERDEERGAIIADPPDILLTNYVMLELILTRPGERPLVRAARGLHFLVLDELHTYRGRQGADVAMLVRRVREATGSQDLQCVGTSATLAGQESVAAQRHEIANVSSLIFGTQVSPDAVVLETLRRASAPLDAGHETKRILRERILSGTPPPEDYEAFLQDPLSRWIEETLGLSEEPQSGRIIRAVPRPIRGAGGAAELLDESTGAGVDKCADAIERALLVGFRILDPTTGFPIFAFKVHQFFSRGETAHASLEPANKRYVTTRAQQFVPGDRERVLLPLAFCRECGQEYYSVRLQPSEDGNGRIAAPRELLDIASESKTETGYLYASEEAPWPDDLEAIYDLLPDDWLEWSGDVIALKPHRRKDLPRSIFLTTDGKVVTEGGRRLHFISTPFRFCPRCGVSYADRARKDYGKLNTLGVGGRASATTILTAAAVRGLTGDSDLPLEARKLLSFTDNRQDASLQAGHFNDFIEVGLLRSGLCRAVASAGDEGIRHDELTQRVYEALGFDVSLYALDPGVRFAARDETDRTFRDVLGYRLYRDLERGWRVTSPNLEQCGLLVIDYISLREVCEAQDIWWNSHPALAESNPAEREKVARTLCDLMRRELAIKVDYLDSAFQERLRQNSNQYLTQPWAIDEEEQLEKAAILLPRSRRSSSRDFGGHYYLSARGGFGGYLRRPNTFSRHQAKLKRDETEEIIQDLLRALREGGLVGVVQDPGPDDVPGYQLMAGTMRWKAGDGTQPFIDPTRIANLPAEGAKTNAYFVDLYKSVAGDGQGLRAKEHTAQVQSEEREHREEEFREARLPILFCSPTMELGVDIAQLNVVNMRNVPPTPANYAQRSGRAGRSGQPALVFTYCASGSSHDQYFFRRPAQMVAGQVHPPAIDLANEDLVRAHVQAVWLAETQQSLGSSLADILETDGEGEPSLELKPSVRDSLARDEPRNRALERCKRILESVPGLDDSDWFHGEWLDSVLNGAPLALDAGCERWRSLYRAARRTRDLQHAVAGDASRPVQDRDRAKRLRAEAESQLEILRADRERQRLFQSDFYSYRYFASEGFLPGYNFPRLPVSAYIPARRGAAGKDEYLSRPRFLAISEFGPRSIVYHEGSRYIINRVVLPVSRSDETQVLVRGAKLCEACGYLHPLQGDAGPDLCENCKSTLPIPLDRLLRLENVSTRRRDRINSDEEERIRQGFEIITGVRFTRDNGRLRVRRGTVTSDGESLADLAYGSAATLWRINLGWSRRANRDQYGFVLDTERGFWARNEQADDPEDPMSQSRERVIPYVEDHRNSLIFEPKGVWDTSHPWDRTPNTFMATFAAALKRATQITFQLEDQELAVESLPTRDNRQVLLFYEAAEGGAGVLRRLVEDDTALSEVAQEALRLCHFDPDTGEDLRRAEGAKEDCEAACYDCVMSYTNQLDHRLLDRKAVKDVLVAMAQAKVSSAPGPGTAAEHLAQLKALSDSDFERSFLDFLHVERYALPSHAQQAIEACSVRPDFLYKEEHVAVYVDGPVHDYPDRQERDRQGQACLEDLGYTVLRFTGSRETWKETLDAWPNVFGKR